MFFYFMLIILILFLLILFSQIKVNVGNLKASIQDGSNKNFEGDVNIQFSWVVLKRMPILSINITKETFNKIHIKEMLKNIDIQKIKATQIDKEKLDKIKKYKPKIEYINLCINIGTENAQLTSYTVAVVSSILGLILKQQLQESINNKFIVNPLFQNKNLLNLELSCIFNIKVIHIIYIIYIVKRRDDKNVRTSNRGAYDYSYE